MKTIELTVGGRTFTATLADKPAAQQFAALLPVHYRMTERNGNEKYYRTDQSFSTQGQSTPDTIEAGQIMLFQDSYVVVFYKTHPNTGYAYTPLATIDDADGLAQAVGADAVEADFAVQ